MTATSDMKPLLDRVVARTRQVEGIEAIVLGGSRARGTADANSDIDLGIYYDPEQPFRVDELSKAAEELDDRHQQGLVTGFGDWGPGVNGGGWLIVEGNHVDFLYRDLRAVRTAIEECLAGKPSSVYQLGHPLGFPNQLYAGEISCCIPLHDPSRSITKLKEMVHEYPETLRAALIRKHLFDAGFELSIAEKPAGRGDLWYVTGCLFRAAGFMTMVLYALNRRWWLNEKGALAQARSFAILPNRFHKVIASTLAEIGRTPAELAESIAHLQDLLAELTTLAQG